MADDNHKRLAAQCWMKGNEALQKENWDYSISMYKTSVKAVPENVVYRQSLRGAEQKKYGMNGKGAAMAGMKLMTTRAKTKTARLKKNWAELAATAEEGLEVNPWDAALNADLGDACKQLGFMEVAAFAYEESLKVDSTNKHVLQSLAEIFESRDEYDKAAGCWERLLKLDPQHLGARSKITALSTKKTLDRGRYDEVGRTGLLADHQIQQRLQATGSSPHGADPGSSIEADLQRAIRKDPENRDNYMKLADYYKREGDLDRALENFQLAFEKSGKNLDIGEKVEDVELEILRQEIDRAKAEAASNPNDADKRKRVGEMAREILDREIDIFERRIVRYPSDLQRKFELAQRYMRKQQWQRAIPLFQQSSGDPRVKGEALVALGKCFGYDGKAPLARRQFEKAIPEVKHDEQADLFKDLHYTFGRLLEEMGDKPAAEEHYQIVIEVDYNYKDANDRLSRLQSS